MIVALAAWAALAGPPSPSPGLVLRWEAPAGCPDGAEVQARVVRLVGEEAARKARLSVRGVVRAAGSGWALDLDLAGETGGGRRSLEAGNCEELAGAAALVVAIAVDPRAASGVVPSPPEPPTAVPVEERGIEAEGAAGAAEPGRTGGEARPVEMSGETGLEEQVEVGGESAAPGEVRDPPGREGQGRSGRPRVRLGVRAAAGVSFARLLPGPSAALSVALSASGRGWRAELGGLYAPPVVGGSSEIGGVFQGGAVELRGGPALTRGRVELPVCAGLQIGAMQGRGRGTGLASASTERALWLAGTLGAALAWRPRERVGLWLQVDAIVALVRPTFVTVGGVLVHEASRFGGQALAGVEVRLR